MARLLEVLISVRRVAGDVDLSRLTPKEIARVNYLSVNETARQTALVAARAISKASGLPAGETKKRITVQKARKGTAEAAVIATGRPIPLYDFQARQRSKGVSAKAWGVRKVYPHTFIATMPTGHTGVFKRGYKVSRLPIKEVWGPGIPGTMAKDEIMNAVTTFAGDRLRVNVARQVDRALRRRALSNPSD